MKQKFTNKILLSAGLLLGIACTANAQAPGSYETNIGGLVIPAGYTVTSVSETYYMGGSTAVTFQTDAGGLDSIFSKKVWISPLATITGAGSMSFNDPSKAGGAASADTIDGNNNPITITKLSNNNPSGIVLGDITENEFGTTNPTGTSAGALVINSPTFTLGTPGANISLNGNDLSLGANTNFVNAGADRMVITGNSTTAHLIKQNQSAAFVFPVGIAANDYTPATITPSATTNIYVAVQDYTQAPTVVAGSSGINRTWSIYGDASSLTATLTLEHNATTNGGGFNQSTSYITNYNGVSWSLKSSATQSNAGSANTEQSVPLLASGATAFYTVTNSLAPLSVILAQPLTATLNAGCSGVVLSWTTGVENNFDHFTLYTSTDDKNFTKVIAQPTAKGSGSSYSFTQTNPESGMNYYQLTGTDKNGSVTIYGTTGINVACAVATVNVYPNPATTQLNVKAGGNSNYQMINEMGAPVLNGSLQAGTNTIGVSSLPAGMYILRVMTNGSINNYKVIIRK
ncbi:MAG: T9SS type A sorting domain-containing protein [Chitinophagaceae bacterium]|jgi:hypothetical protein|nr:T9SS type A sorting domain-containing protein [Chitinophagaceae bacterium]